MNPIYKRNLKALNKKGNYNFNQLPEINYDIKILVSMDGNNTLLFSNEEKRLYLHSKYTPTKEARDLVERIKLKNRGVILVFGFGLGYHVEEIIKQMSEDTALIIFEPSKLILKKTMECLDHSSIIEHPKLHIIIDEYDKFSSLLRKHIRYEDIECMKVVLLDNYSKAFKKEYNKVLDIIDEIILEHKLSINTIYHFSRIWERNIIRNLPALLKSQDIGVLDNKYNGVPIIVISAGPSLSKNLLLVKEIEDKSIIVCVGTALKTLLDIGVVPDYVVVIDGGKINFQHFKDIDYDNTRLVFSPKVYPDIMNKHNGHKFRFCVEDFILKEILNSLSIKTSTLNGEVSVSTFALSLAIKMGGRPIIFLGQDLAFTDDRTHSVGTVYEKLKVEKDNFLITRIDMYGNQVFTTVKLLEVKRVLEKLIEESDYRCTFINATEGGLSIKGTKEMSLSQVINLYFNEGSEHVNKCKYLLTKEVVYNNIQTEQVIHILLGLKDVLSNTQRIVEEALMVVSATKGERFKPSEIKAPQFGRLDELNIKIEEELNKLAVIKYSLRIIYDKSLDYQDTKERYEIVYKSLLDCFAEMLEVIDDSIKSLKGMLI